MGIREQQKAMTKKSIAAAVTRLSKEKGIENLKVREICQEANVSIGTFYNYYDTIESIVLDFIVENDKNLKEATKDLIVSDNELRNLEAYVRYSVIHFRNVPNSLLKAIMKVFIYYPEMEILAVNRATFDIVYGIISRGQEKGQMTTSKDASFLTKMIVKLIIGNCFVNVMHSENFDFTQT